MLYDKRWSKQGIKANPFSLDSLVAWAEEQPADKTYDFWCDRCYLGQYFEAHGLRIDLIGVGTVTFKGEKTRNLPLHFNDIAMTRPYTFGAALARARAALSFSRPTLLPQRKEQT